MERPPRRPDVEQTFFIRQWPVDDGAPFNACVGVIRGRDGSLWVATRAGLFQFDGVDYRPVFRLADRGLSGMLYTTMHLDRRGRVWVTVDGGTVARIDGSSVKVFTAGREVPAMKPISIAEDADGVVWLSYFHTRNLCRIGDDRAEIVAADPARVHDDVVVLHGDPQGRIWFESGHRLGILRDGRLETLAHVEQQIDRAGAAASGGLWLIAGRRLCRWDGEGPPRDVATANWDDVQRLYEDRRGRLWIATRGPTGAGLQVFDGREFHPVPVWSPSIASLSGDDEDNVWVGSRRTGLIQVRPRTLELVTPANKIPPGIQSVCEDASDGTLFAVAAHGQLLRQDGPTWSQLTDREGWTGGAATFVVPDPRGGVWVGSGDRGLHFLRDGTFTVYGADAGVPQRAVIRAAMPDDRGDVWIGIEGNPLMRLHAGRAEAVPGAPAGVLVIVPDTEGVWVATADGRLLHGGVDGFVDRTPPLPDRDPIRSLLRTGEGILWIGFQSGRLGRLAADAFHVHPPEFAPYPAPITQLVADERGWLWCGTPRGIFRVAIADLEAAAAGKAGGVRSICCGTGEGWPQLKASGDYWPRSLRRRSGELCLPVSTGLAVVVPERSLENPSRPVVQITSLRVNGRPLPVPAPDESTGGIRPPLEAGAGVRQLGVEFGVISFAGRDNIRYRYRLEGLDDEWLEAGPQRVAYFGQVPPGRYRFHVIACNNENVWNDDGATLDVIVKARYWETAWFRWLSWLGAGGILGAIAWWGSRRRVRRQLEWLQREHDLDQERERIARDMHDDLGADLSNIATLADLLQPSADAAARSRLDELGGLAENVVRRLEEIVWAVNPENDSVDRFATFLCRIVQSHLEPAGISARFDVPVDLPDAPLSSQQRHNLLLAAKEALHNAIRHGAPNQVAIRITLCGGRLEVTVADDGRGFISTEDLPSGHGSANMRDRMREVDGTFERRSAPGQGTIVILSIPLPAPVTRSTP